MKQGRVKVARMSRFQALPEGPVWRYLFSAMASVAETIQKNVVAGRRNRYVGEVVYMYAFDVAYEMTRHPVRELLGQPVAEYVFDASKRNPRHLFFYRPQMVRLP